VRLGSIGVSPVRTGWKPMLPQLKTESSRISVFAAFQRELHLPLRTDQL
jgi:hypothetical protein